MSRKLSQCRAGDRGKVNGADRAVPRVSHISDIAFEVRVLAEILTQMAQGHPVTLVPLEAEFSTQQAAELMGVSRPFFIRLLETGKLPFRKVGEHRRVRCEDLRFYMEAEKKARHEVLNEMTAEAQRLGLYE